METGKRVGLGMLFVACAIASAAAQGGKNIPRADSVVKPKTYVNVQPVPRGTPLEIAVVAEILPGFHINANKPSEEYLIPTAVQAELPAGVRLTSTEYPAGKLVKFDFSEKKLSVYDGQVVIRMKLQAGADAALGKMKLPLSLRYQACNDSACLPPVKLQLTTELEIGPVGAKVHAVNAGIFRKR